MSCKFCETHRKRKTYALKLNVIATIVTLPITLSDNDITAQITFAVFCIERCHGFVTVSLIEVEFCDN